MAGFADDGVGPLDETLHIHTYIHTHIRAYIHTYIHTYMHRWDHWMRLSTTSLGRECVAPEINRSRHASARGTNVLDNKPFERFTFEETGVPSFGDVSYILRDKYEPAVSAAVATSQIADWPSAWGGSSGKEAARGWMSKLPKERPTVLLYTREQYKDLAKPLGIWAVSHVSK